MKTYLQILQLHAKVRDISYPNNLIKKDVKLPTVLWNQSPPDLVVGGFQPPDQSSPNLVVETDQSSPNLVVETDQSSPDLVVEKLRFSDQSSPDLVVEKLRFSDQSSPDLVVEKLRFSDQTVDDISFSSENFWACLFRKEDDGELSYEDNCVHFQLYFLISSMAYFYDEPIEKQISRKHLLIGQAVTNMFLSNNVKAKLSDIFHKTQWTYMVFTRFANVVRHKINKEKIDFDLRMEPIDISSKFSISLLHNGAKYYFGLTDLVNIIQTAITHSDDMFGNPLFPKNPYNNLPFTKTMLYNIYFRIKFVFLNVPEWIQLFYNCDFDIDVFKVENEQKLREKYIKNYVNNGSITVLNEEVNSMISSYKHTFRRIHINQYFPKKDLVDIFRPYLFLYIMSIDGIEGIEKKHLSGIILKKKLAEFVLFNENFGRKIVSNQDCRRIVTFNMNHPHFTFKDACESFDKKKIFKISSRTVIEASRNIIPSPASIDSYEDDNDSIVSSDEESSREEEIVYNYEYNNYNSIPLRDLLSLDIYNELNHLGDLADSFS
jgi:hypothetical protein